MKLSLSIIILLTPLCLAGAELPAEFARALHIIESSGRLGAIKGDNGQALGPLQIHRAYHADSGVKGKYEQCADLEYSKKVVAAYLARYCPKALKQNNFEVLARVHNGGPMGHKNPNTIKYFAKIRKHLK